MSKKVKLKSFYIKLKLIFFKATKALPSGGFFFYTNLHNSIPTSRPLNPLVDMGLANRTEVWDLIFSPYFLSISTANYRYPTR